MCTTDPNSKRPPNSSKTARGAHSFKASWHVLTVIPTQYKNSFKTSHMNKGKMVCVCLECTGYSVYIAEEYLLDRAQCDILS